MNMKIIAGMLGVVSLLTAGLANASTVSVSPAAVTAVPGGSFAATVQADFSDVVGGTSGGGFQLTWETTLLTLNEGASGVSSEISTVLLNQFINNGGDAGFTIITVNAAAGTLDFSFTLCPLLSPCDALSVFPVFDLTFDVSVAANGQTPLGLGINAINDPWFQDDGATTIDPAYIGATVDVSAVPVPASVWLLGSGLLGLVGVARRRRLDTVQS